MVKVQSVEPRSPKSLLGESERSVGTLAGIKAVALNTSSLHCLVPLVKTLPAFLEMSLIEPVKINCTKS